MTSKQSHNVSWKVFMVFYTLLILKLFGSGDYVCVTHIYNLPYFCSLESLRDNEWCTDRVVLVSLLCLCFSFTKFSTTTIHSFYNGTRKWILVIKRDKRANKIVQWLPCLPPAQAAEFHPWDPHGRKTGLHSCAWHTDTWKKRKRGTGGRRKER